MLDKSGLVWYTNTMTKLLYTTTDIVAAIGLSAYFGIVWGVLITLVITAAVYLVSYNQYD